MAINELTKKLAFINPRNEEKQVTLYDDYTQFGDYDNGNYIAVQTEEGTGYVYCNSTLPDDASDHFASFIDKNSNVRYAYLTRQDDTRILIAKYTFNSTTNTLPTFNDGYTYTTKDTDNGDGTVTREIYSDTPPTSIKFSSAKALKTLDYLDTSNCTSLESLFCNCKNVTSIDMSKSDTSKVINMFQMFRGCDVLTSLNLTNFDTSSVTDISYMFSDCLVLTSLDLSSFDTSNVEFMGYMFSGCSKLTSLDLSSFDTSNVEFMGYMFSGCSKLTSLNLSSFNTVLVTNMSNMFKDCESLTALDLRNFETENVTTMSYMFAGCRSLRLLKLNNFSSTKLRNFEYMFITVPSNCGISIGNSFRKSESQTGFNGKFTHVQ